MEFSTIETGCPDGSDPTSGKMTGVEGTVRMGKVQSAGGVVRTD